MHTPHQFLLLSSPPAKESNFRAAKKLFGSTFAFQWVWLPVDGSMSLPQSSRNVWGGKHSFSTWLLALSSPLPDTWLGNSRFREGTWLIILWPLSKIINVWFYFVLPPPLCFSGSHIENWHSILRNGLVVASNTRLQVNFLNALTRPYIL